MDQSSSKASRLLQSVKLAAAVLSQFTTDHGQPLDKFITNYLIQKNVSPLPELKTSVLDLCQGCLDHHKVLRGVIGPFLKKPSQTTLHRDLQMIKAFVYILLFHFNSYSRPQLLNLMERFYSFSLRRFLLYFVGYEQDPTDTPILDSVKAEWYLSFDRDYVDRMLLKPYCENVKKMQALVHEVELSHKCEDKTQPERKKKLTVATPFQLRTSEPPLSSSIRYRKRTVKQVHREKEQANVNFKARDVPSTTFHPLESTITMQQKAEERRKRGDVFGQKLKERETLKKKAREIDDNMRRSPSKKEDDSLPIRLLTRMVNKSVPKEPIKATTTALLREKALLLKHKNKTMASVRAMAEGAGNTEEHQARLRELEEKDLEASIIEDERRIISAMQSLEKAILAKNLYLEEARNRALEEKQLQKEYRERRQREIDAEILELRSSVEMAQAVSHVHLMEAKRRIGEEKLRSAKRVKEETNQIYQQCVSQQEEEMRKRKEVIAQIHELESRLANYERTFDFGMVRKYGFLTDISLADLKDRLIALRFEEMDKISEKRAKITEDRENWEIAMIEAKNFVEVQRPLWQARNKQESKKIEQMKELRNFVRSSAEFLYARHAVIINSRERRERRRQERLQRPKK